MERWNENILCENDKIHKNDESGIERYRNVTAHLSHKEASPTPKKQKAFNFRMAKRTACNVTTLPGPLKGGDYAFLCALQQL